MIVDLNPLPFIKAVYIIKWCYAHDIDKEKCAKLLQTMKTKSMVEELEWSLDIPDKYMTWFEIEDAA